MRKVLDVVRDAVAGRGLLVHKAIPRSERHLLLELVDADGHQVAGQSFACEEEGVAVWEETCRAGPSADVDWIAGAGVLLQPRGADRRLRRLARLVDSPNATLLAHRPEQRAVVRRAAPGQAPTYAKVVRTKRFDRILRGARIPLSGLRTPRLISADKTTGVVAFGELEGQTLHDLLSDQTLPDCRLEAACRAVGRAVAHLHRADPPQETPLHDAAADAAVTQRWVDLARAYGLGDRLPTSAERLVRSAREQLAEAPAPAGLLHRDLHDKQVLIDGEQVGMLDFDLAAVGDPALDVANLLVHLELRARQGLCTERRAKVCAAAVLDGYGPVSEVFSGRLAAYEITTRVRLAAVYAFRPAHAATGAALLERLGCLATE